MKKKLQVNKRNSKILRETMFTLRALKEQTKLNNIPMHEIQVHLLDEDGYGIVLCLEYDEQMEGINKTFHSMEEYYDDSIVEVELEQQSPENVKEFLRKRIEETISEEYDEIFHNSDNDDDPPPLLN